MGAGEKMSKYFVWRLSDDYPYRVYGTRRHVEPWPDDARCIWRGASHRAALDVARNANQARRMADKPKQLTFT